MHMYIYKYMYIYRYRYPYRDRHRYSTANTCLCCPPRGRVSITVIGTLEKKEKKGSEKNEKMGRKKKAKKRPKKNPYRTRRPGDPEHWSTGALHIKDLGGAAWRGRKHRNRIFLMRLGSSSIETEHFLR